MNRPQVPIQIARRAAFRKLFDLTESDAARLPDRALSVLSYVCECKIAPTIQEISAAESVHPSQVSRMAMALTAAGYTERHVGAGDRRGTVIKPTPDGRALARRIKSLVDAVTKTKARSDAA